MWPEGFDLLNATSIWQVGEVLSSCEWGLIWLLSAELACDFVRDVRHKARFFKVEL